MTGGRLMSADDHVDDLLEHHPYLNTLLMKMGIVCVQCGEVFWGTLGELIRSKGRDVSEVLKELNAKIADVEHKSSDAGEAAS
jgi:hypothetical protein